MDNILKHVAIIMDGNGRWAKERNRPRFWGHVRGAYRVSDIVERASNIGIEALTLYAFSTENWTRPVDEINILFKLLKKYLKSEFARIVKNKISFKVIGDTSQLDSETLELINELEASTKTNSGLKLTFCFGYSGRSEIINAINKLLSEGHKEITEEMITQYMMRPEIGDVDLLIRTGGDQRVSNFLLWQIAYAELYFESEKWPDFSANQFEDIIRKVQKRDRRYGRIENTVLTYRESQSSSMNNLNLIN
ncbi:polyprenyl diphosphate synthase [Bacteriovoracaceae bacterium]|nr:polyprenyl diphosphate synthase [Bacteriovoracaceae bacterium]